MPRFLELRRHTDNDGDVLSPKGITAAVTLGATLSGNYEAVWTSGAQRAAQTAACLLAGLGESVPRGVIVEAGLRSHDEDQWRAAYQIAGTGDIESLSRASPTFVAQDSKELAGALRSIFEQLSDGGRGLAIGHSPTNEAAVYQLTSVAIAPLGKGRGVLITQISNTYTVDGLD
jgi:broad specificity phosphatase PhoE